jgi:hypothetical protein
LAIQFNFFLTKIFNPNGLLSIMYCQVLFKKIHHFANLRWNLTKSSRELNYDGKKLFTFMWHISFLRCDLITRLHKWVGKTEKCILNLQTIKQQAPAAESSNEICRCVMCVQAEGVMK